MVIDNRIGGNIKEQILATKSYETKISFRLLKVVSHKQSSPDFGNHLSPE